MLVPKNSSLISLCTDSVDDKLIEEITASDNYAVKYVCKFGKKKNSGNIDMFVENLCSSIPLGLYIILIHLSAVIDELGRGCDFYWNVENLPRYSVPRQNT